MAEVTIVIPLYNKENAIVRAIDSIRRQTFEDWQLIVVDDGSTDSGADIVSGIDDRRIEMVRQQNAGPGAARNAGIARADSKYLAFLDADDQWYPWYLANALKAFEINSAPLVASMFHVWPTKLDWMSFLLQYGLQMGMYSLDGSEDPARVKVMLASIKPWNTVLQTETARKYGGFYEDQKCLYGEDLTFFMRVVFNEPFVFVGPTSVRYHGEESELDPYLVTSHAKPQLPFLAEPETVRKYCPTEKQDLLSKLLALYASAKIQEWADNGRKAQAWNLLKQYPSVRACKQEYRKCITQILLGSSAADLLKENLKEACKLAFWAVARFLKRTFRSPMRRDILFVCENALSAEYLADVWELLSDNKHLRFFLRDSSARWVHGRPGTERYIRQKLPVTIIRSQWDARMHWDLIIAADHCRPHLVNNKHCKTLFVPHGIECSLNYTGNQNTFCDNALDKNGKCRYTRMFTASDASRDIAIESNPVFADPAVVTGDLRYDILTALTAKRKEIRKQMGFKSDDIVVLVLSTCGPDCLYETMGDAILTEAKKLMERFHFILDVHPYEYRTKPASQRTWGEYLHTQKEHGFIVRHPDEDWMPYMAACDVILADHTSLALYGALLERPVVYVPLPKFLKNNDSLMRRLYELSPVIKDDASDLGQCLQKATDDYPLEKIRELTSRINSYPAQSRQRILKELLSLLKLPLSENI